MANQVRFKKNNNNISLIILGSLSNDNDNGGDYMNVLKKSTYAVSIHRSYSMLSNLSKCW